MSKLSPQAQAVVDAVEDDCIHPTDLHRIAAAALRAAADQVVPYVHSPGGCREGERQCVRREFLAIAAELDPGDRVEVGEDRRDAECVARWPDCVNGGYDPKCCRFPKSCSCGGD